ncbi:MAG: nitrate- and nitrite sensing domain-containing protein [Cohaesibacter sp.]|jgi:methyl-accepting chemotaxis protein|nr:nitrate- and nitrite sensing domain-containing protein [Cohaesibacter sp.]
MQLSITQKIMAVFLAVLVPMSYFIATDVAGTSNRLDEAKTVKHMLDVAPSISAVVHELQKERGQSAVFIGSKGLKMVTTLPVQRKDSDGAISKLETAIANLDRDRAGEEFLSRLEKAQDNLGKLASKRGEISSLSYTVPQMAKYYTSTISSLLHSIDNLENVSNDAATANAIKNYTSVLWGKEKAGIERAMGGGGFGAGEFNQVVYMKLVSLAAQQETLFGTARKRAPIELVSQMDKIFAEPIFGTIKEWRKIAYANPFGGSLEGYEGPKWFDLATQRINRLKVIEDTFAQEILRQAQMTEDMAFNQMIVALAIGLTAIIVSVGIAFIVIRGMKRSVGSLVADAKRLAAGDTSASFDVAEQSDELGQVARSVVVFRDNVREQKVLQERMNEETSERQKRNDYVDQLIRSFDKDVQSVLKMVDENTAILGKSATELSSMAGTTLEQATNASGASEEASSNVHSIAAATEELSSSVGEIHRQVDDARGIISKASDMADTTTTKVQSLDLAVQSIGKVMTLIQDIAEQTNLLALNATIEAARAGEMGKGFAVVASEVKELANQTSKATEEIDRQISAVQTSTNEAVGAIEEIAGIMTKVDDYTTAIATAVTQQGSATSEISTNAQLAAGGTQNVASNMSNVSDAVNQTSLSAGNVQTASDDLVNHMGSLRQEISSFLEKVKAA